MIQNMAKYIDAESDYFYIKGQETEQTKFVKNLLTDSDFTIDKIAKIAGVAVDFVKSVKRQLSAN
jgi:DNA-dependent RNA polymerase auxiliary subunit epsilon